MPSVAPIRQAVVADIADETTDRVLVHGALLDREGGEGPLNARVGFSNDEGSQSAAVRNSSFAAAEMTPGTWTVRVRADGFARYRAEHQVLPTANQRLDLTLDRAQRVEVFVQTPTGEPMPDLAANLRRLNVVVSQARLPDLLPVTESTSLGDVGLARFKRLGKSKDWQLTEPLGELQLDRPPPLEAALLFRHVVLARATIAPRQERVTFVLEPSAITNLLCTVRARWIDGDAASQRLAKAVVSLKTAQGGGVSDRPDEEGRTELTGVMPGLLRLSVDVNYIPIYRQVLRLAPGEIRDLGDVVLQPPTSISGTLQRENGEPMAGYVQWSNLDNRTFPSELTERHSYKTEGDGAFQLKLPPHRHVLVAYSLDQKRRGVALVDARTPLVGPVTIQLVPAVEIQVITELSRFEAVVVTLLDPAGTPVAVRRIEPYWRNQTLMVPPGNYTLQMHDDQDVLLQEMPVRAQGETMRVELKR